MKKWLVMDVFHQVHGPYDKVEVKALLRRGNKFFVATPGFDRWVPVDYIPEFTYIPPLPVGPGASPATQLDAREMEKRLAELIGICRGVIADGVVAPEEAVFLRDWLAKHQSLLDCWPADVISKRLEQVFEDGRVDEQEQEDLLVLLRMITSEDPPVNEATAKAVPLPVTMPEPQVEFLGKHFCLTGRFVYGPHSYCKQAIARRGGKVDARPGLRTDYLVIGGLSLSDWQHSPDARKIYKAVQQQKEGQLISVVSEENWSISLSAN